MRRILPAPLRARSPGRPPALASLGTAVAALWLAVLLAGCGLKGDLFLPDETPPAAPAPAEEDEDEDGA